MIVVVQFAKSCPTLCDPQGLQHISLPCPLLSPWSLLKLMSFHLVMPSIISSSVALPSISCLLLLPSIFPSIRIFSNEWKISGGQSIGASASASVLTVNIQGWFPLGLTGLISLLSKGLKSLLQHHNSNNSSDLSLIYGPTLTIHTWLLEKP